MRNFFRFVFNTFVVLLFVGLIITLLVTYDSYPSEYEAKPISGVVFDAESRKPVEGAVVVAIWSEYGGAFQAYKIDELEVQETVTDSQGKYTLPGWPLKRSRNWSAFVPTDEPRIFAYKYKYSPKYIYNGIVQEMGRRQPYKHERTISWHGSTDIYMSPLIYTENERWRIESQFIQITPSIYYGCGWKKLTHLLLEVDKQRIEIESHWYLSEGDGHRPECPGAIKLIENARKSKE